MSLRIPSSPPTRRLRRRRGQALAEFALSIGVLLAITITALEMAPAIAARGAVLEAASAATIRVTNYLGPETASANAERNAVCQQIIYAVKQQLDGYPVRAGNGCSPRSARPSGSINLMVWVSALNPNGTPNEGTRLVIPTGSSAPVPFQVCVSYRYAPERGLLWLAAGDGAGVSSDVKDFFTYTFCGRDVLDPYRTR